MMNGSFIERTFADERFKSDRDGACTVSHGICRPGERIATAPASYWQRLDQDRWGRRVGHRRCAIRARIEEREHAERVQ
jgi:hypothetical protein